MGKLERLAELIRSRNRIEADIAALIGRPAHPGHVGEFVAANLFNIQLESSGTTKGIDGRFASGPLAGHTVNVKFYPKNYGILDINPEGVPDYYLVLAGPRVPAASSRGTVCPWVITSVFLFEARELLAKLRERPRPVKIGVATSVVRPLWDEAEVYPTQRNRRLQLTEDQRRLLTLFSET